MVKIFSKLFVNNEYVYLVCLQALSSSYRRMGDLTVDASIHISVLGGTIENNCFEEVDSCVQSSTLYFKPDQDELYYNFTVFDDTFIEEDESLTLSLSEGHNVIPMSNKSRITIVITDNEPPSKVAIV